MTKECIDPNIIAEEMHLLSILESRIKAWMDGMTRLVTTLTSGIKVFRAQCRSFLS